MTTARASEKPTKRNGKPKPTKDVSPANGTVPEQPEANGSTSIIDDEDNGKRGRPTFYKPEYPRIAQAMCELGATDAELAAAFGVDTTTIWRWQSLHVEFCNAVQVGKAPADNRVARSLYQRAVGYTFDTEKLFSHQGSVTRAKTVEHVPPDPGAAKLWLCNRLPDEWRDTAKLEVTGKNGEALQVDATAAVRALLEAMPDLGVLGNVAVRALAAPAEPAGGEERS